MYGRANAARPGDEATDPRAGPVRTYASVVNRTILPLLLLPLAGCATVLTGRVLDSESGAPVPGATVLVEPVAPLPTPGKPALEQRSAPDARAEVVVGEDGAFVLTALIDEQGAPTPLPSGWAYEVRAEALGFFTSVERVDVRRAAEVELRILALDEVDMDGEIIEGEAAERHDGLEGGLVDEILRRNGRAPGR